MTGIVYTQDMEFDADVVFDVVSRRLPAVGVDAVMIGGHAVNHYGVSRATQDIDFMIAAADEGAVRRVMQPVEGERQVRRQGIEDGTGTAVAGVGDDAQRLEL